MITRERLIELSKFCDSIYITGKGLTHKQTTEIGRLVDFYVVRGLKTSPVLNHLHGVSAWIDTLIDEELRERSEQ